MHNKHALSLRAIPTFIVSACKERRKDILNRLGFLNITFIDAPLMTPRFFGGAMGFLNLLTNRSIVPPFLLLEDDVDITAYYKDNLSVPEHGDAVYLGTYRYGIPRSYPYEGGVKYVASDYDEEFVRVFSMLTTHAILVLSRSYMQLMMGALRQCMVEATYGYDINLSKIMERSNIYAFKRPLFYQSCIYSNSDYQACVSNDTLCELEPSIIGDRMDYIDDHAQKRRVVMDSASGVFFWKDI